MEPLCMGKDYEEKFDIDWYLALYDKDCYALREGGAMHCLHGILSEMAPKSDGTMLEFGSGPSIHMAISASRVFPNITVAEYAKPNREAILKWLRQEPGAHDWGPVMARVASWEGISPKDVEDRTRAAIKKVIPCDVNRGVIVGDGSEDPSHQGPYDFLTTSLCLEVASPDLDTYQQAVGQLCGLLRPGASAFVCGALSKTYYMVGDVRFYCLSLTRDQVVGAFEAGGMAVKSLDTIVIEGWEEYTEGSDLFYMLHAVKEL